MASVLELSREAESGYRIEKGVPVPEGQGRGGAPRFPLKQLEVGDSFFVPFGKSELKTRSVLSNAITAFHLRNKPRRLISRKDGNGIRVWRTA